MFATDAARGAIPYPSATFLQGNRQERECNVVDGQPATTQLDRPAAQPSSGAITVLVEPSGFAQSLGPCQAAAAIAEGVHAESGSARVLQVPVFDGGEGFTQEMVRLAGGTIESLRVSGPHGQIVTARLGLIGPPHGRTAVIEIEEAIHLRRLPPDRRDPTRASSRGVGQLIAAALDRGVRRIIIGCGDSGANDGGIGMAAALGVRFLDASRAEIVEAGGLQRLAAIDLSHRDQRLDDVTIEAVVNPYDDLLGDHGVLRVYGPVKGASQAQVLRLERGFLRYADIIRRVLAIDVASLPGAGASGGVGAGLAAFTGARLTRRLDFLRYTLGFETSIAVTDLVITAAGCSDPAPPGEVPAWVMQQANALGLPIIALAGQDSIDAVADDKPMQIGRDEGRRRTGEWLRDASARAIRIALGGLKRGVDRRERPRPFVGEQIAARG